MDLGGQEMTARGDMSAELPPGAGRVAPVAGGRPKGSAAGIRTSRGH
jgi:hypothetical protein